MSPTRDAVRQVWHPHGLQLHPHGPALSAVPAAPAALLPATSVSAAFVPATAVAVPSSVTPAVADESAGIPASAAGKVRATSAAAPGSGTSEELMRRNSAPPKPAAITIAAMPPHSASNRRAGLIRTGSCPCGFSSLSNAGASVKFLNLSTPTPLWSARRPRACGKTPAVVNILCSGSVAVQRTCQFIGKRYPLLLRREGYHAAGRKDCTFGKPPGTAPLDKSDPARQEHPLPAASEVADKAVSLHRPSGNCSSFLLFWSRCRGFRRAGFRADTR